VEVEVEVEVGAIQITGAVHRLGVRGPWGVGVEVMRVVEVIRATAVAVVATLPGLGAAVLLEVTVLLLQVVVIRQAVEALHRIYIWKWQLHLPGRDLKQQWGCTSIVERNRIYCLPFVRFHRFDKVYHQIGLGDGHTNHSKFRYIV
jgi:hypothetical protein